MDKFYPLPPLTSLALSHLASSLSCSAKVQKTTCCHPPSSAWRSAYPFPAAVVLACGQPLHSALFCCLHYWSVSLKCRTLLKSFFPRDSQWSGCSIEDIWLASLAIPSWNEVQLNRGLGNLSDDDDSLYEGGIGKQTGAFDTRPTGVKCPYALAHSSRYAADCRRLGIHRCTSYESEKFFFPVKLTPVLPVRRHGRNRAAMAAMLLGLRISRTPISLWPASIWRADWEESRGRLGGGFNWGINSPSMEVGLACERVLSCDLKNSCRKSLLHFKPSLALPAQYFRVHGLCRSKRKKWCAAVACTWIICVFFCAKRRPMTLFIIYVRLRSASVYRWAELSKILFLQPWGQRLYVIPGKISVQFLISRKR